MTVKFEGKLKVKFIKRKLINKTQYFTTDHFINMEVDMTDKFLELFNCDNRLSAYDCIESFENSGDRYSKKDSIQQRGVKCLIEHNFAILTGGPGTGKSTCVVDAIRYCNIDEEHVCICAPTGNLSSCCTCFFPSLLSHSKHVIEAYPI